MGAADVVVNGGGDAHHAQGGTGCGGLPGERQGAPEGAVAADGDDSVQPQQLAGGQSLVAALLGHKLFAPGRIEDGAALVNDVADAGGVHPDEIAVDQAVPAPADAHALDPLGQCGADHRAYCGIHARGIAAAGQNADPLYLVLHMLVPPNPTTPCPAVCQRGACCHPDRMAVWFRFFMSLFQKPVK